MSMTFAQLRTTCGVLMVAAAFGMAACDLIGGEQLPPKKLLAGIITTPTTIDDPKNTRLVQLAAFFDDGRWKRVDASTYTLRVDRKDPTSDRPQHLGFLIAERDQPDGSVLANITHATLNGEDVSDEDVLRFVDQLDLPPVPAGYPPPPPDWRDAAVAADPKDPPGVAVQKAALAEDHFPATPGPTTASAPSAYVTNRPATAQSTAKQ